MTDQQRVTDEQLTEWEHYKLATGHVGLGLRQQRDLVADLRASRARGAELDRELGLLRIHAGGLEVSLGERRAERDVLQQRIDKALAATYASDDGTEYSHSHRRGEGEPDCPACWVHDIRAALTGAAESHGERPPGPGTPADPVSGGTVQHSGRESGPDA